MKTEDRVPDFFELDQHRLDTEWTNQPKLYYEHAKQLADARTAYEQAKAELDVVAAEVDREVRSNPAVFGLEKVTEKAVETAVLLDKRHRRHTAEVIDIKHAMDIAQAAVNTLDHRKKALESLVQLFLANYFSSPRPKGDNRERMEELEKDSAFNVRDRKRGG